MRISDWSSDVCSSDLKAADPIIMHPDVRRMLLTMKAFAEGNRAMVYFTAKQVDIVKYSQDEAEKKQADALLAFRSEERRVGKEVVSKCRSRWSPDHAKKK